MNTLTIVYILIFSVFVIYGIYQIASGTDHAQPPSTGDGEQPVVGEDSKGDKRESTQPDSSSDEISVEELDLPTRAENAILSAGIENVEELKEYQDDYTEISGVGEGYAEEIDRAVKTS